MMMRMAMRSRPTGVTYGRENGLSIKKISNNCNPLIAKVMKNQDFFIFNEFSSFVDILNDLSIFMLKNTDDFKYKV